VYGKLTSAVSADAVYGFVFAALEETSVAGLACTVVTTVPPTAHTISFFPALLAWSDGDDVADDLVTWDEAFL
jgi:hypothetical protein